MGNKINEVQILVILNFHHHFLGYVCLPNSFRELLEADLAILVLIRQPHGLVHHLLKLRVLQVGAHHHLKHLKKFSITNISVIIQIIYTESKLQLGILVSLNTELGDTLKELLEVNLPTTILIEDINHPLHQGVLPKLWQTHELHHTYGARPITVQLLESFSQPGDFLGRECGTQVQGGRLCIAHGGL